MLSEQIALGLNIVILHTLGIFQISNQTICYIPVIF